MAHNGQETHTNVSEYVDSLSVPVPSSSPNCVSVAGRAAWAALYCSHGAQAKVAIATGGNENADQAFPAKSIKRSGVTLSSLPNGGSAVLPERLVPPDDPHGLQAM